MTIKIIEKISGNSNKVQKLKNSLKEIAEISKKELGCLKYDLYQDKKNLQNFYIYMIFKDQSAYEIHINSDHIKLFNQKYGDDLYSGFEEIFLEQLN